METKKFTDGRTDAEGYNIIRPFFKRAYKKLVFVKFLCFLFNIFFSDSNLVWDFFSFSVKHKVTTISQWNAEIISRINI